jgi:hypothetical protein
MGICNSKQFEIIQDEIFELLENMLKQNVIMAVQYIDRLLQKNLKDADYNRLEKIKTQAVMDVIKPQIVAGVNLN